MAEFPINSEDIIVDFLRANLTDPRDRAEDANTNNVTATAGQTEITLSPTANTTVSVITSVTINAVTSKKWKDYHWDYQNQKITFFTALSLNDDVIITFKEGSTNWIYPDKPDDELSKTNFPRINMFTVTAPGERLGQFEAPVEGSIILQIDVWSKDGYIATIGGIKYSNDNLTRYLGGQITRAFEKNEEDLFPVLYNYRPVSGPRTAPFAFEYQAFHSIMEVNLKGLRIGRIET